MKNELFKAHPIFLLRNSKGLSFLLILLIFRYNGVYSFLILFTLLMYLILRYKSFKLIISERKMLICMGFLFGRATEIPVEKISTVEIFRYPTDRIFGTITVRVNTEADTSRAKNRFVLSKRDEKRFLKSVNIRVDEQEIHFAIKNIAVLAIAQSSVVSGVLFVVPLIRRLGILLGIEITEIIVNEIENITHILPYYFPVLNTLSLGFLFLYFCAFLFFFTIFLRFRISKGAEHIKTTYGMLTQRTVYITKRLIGGYMVAQTLPLFIFNKKFMTADILHSKTNKIRQIILSPAFNGEIVAVDQKENILFPQKSERYRYFKAPFLIVSLFLPLLLIAIQKKTTFNQIFLFFCLLCLAYALLLSFYSLYNCRNNKIYFGKMVSVCGSKGQKIYESALFYDKIGEIKIMRFPLDVKNKTSSVRITLRTANGTSVKAKYVSYPILKEQIDKKLKLYE